jgi:hypothetical protein
MDMGLIGEPIEKIRKLNPREAEAALDDLKKEARRRGRRLLGSYHPDKNPADVEEAFKNFQAVKLVLEKIDTLRVVQAPRPPPRVSYTITYYPSTSPYGGTATSASTSTGYFTYEHRTAPAGVPYDARRVVLIRPK